MRLIDRMIDATDRSIDRCDRYDDRCDRYDDRCDRYDDRPDPTRPARSHSHSTSSFIIRPGDAAGRADARVARTGDHAARATTTTTTTTTTTHGVDRVDRSLLNARSFVRSFVKSLDSIVNPAASSSPRPSNSTFVLSGRGGRGRDGDGRRDRRDRARTEDDERRDTDDTDDGWFR